MVLLLRTGWPLFLGAKTYIALRPLNSCILALWLSPFLLWFFFSEYMMNGKWDQNFLFPGGSGTRNLSTSSSPMSTLSSNYRGAGGSFVTETNTTTYMSGAGTASTKTHIYNIPNIIFKGPVCKIWHNLLFYVGKSLTYRRLVRKINVYSQYNSVDIIGWLSEVIWTFLVQTAAVLNWHQISHLGWELALWNKPMETRQRCAQVYARWQP